MHRWQPAVLLFGIVSSVGMFGGLFQDVIRPLMFRDETAYELSQSTRDLKQTTRDLSITAKELSEQKDREPNVIKIVVSSESINQEIAELAQANKVELSILKMEIERLSKVGSPIEQSASAFLRKDYENSFKLSDEAILDLQATGSKLEIDLGYACQIKALSLFGLRKPAEALGQALAARKHYTSAGDPNMARHLTVVTAGHLFMAITAISPAPRSHASKSLVGATSRTMSAAPCGASSQRRAGSSGDPAVTSAATDSGTTMRPICRNQSS